MSKTERILISKRGNRNVYLLCDELLGLMSKLKSVWFLTYCVRTIANPNTNIQRNTRDTHGLLRCILNLLYLDKEFVISRQYNEVVMYMYMFFSMTTGDVLQEVEIKFFEKSKGRFSIITYEIRNSSKKIYIRIFLPEGAADHDH